MKTESKTTYLANPGRVACAIAVVILSVTASGWASERILYTFRGGNGGQYPQRSLVMDASGNLYGATTDGGPKGPNCPTGCGVVFELTKNSDGAWSETVLYTFQGGRDGSHPFAGVIIDANGNLYGTTYDGGGGECVIGGTNAHCGIVFELSPSSGGSWTETILYKFTGQNDGGFPVAGVISDSVGNLYGISAEWGVSNCPGYNPGQGCGALWELTPTLSGPWTETTLHDFTGLDGDGSAPSQPLAFDRQGNIYGTTDTGGISNNACPNGCGTLFELTPVAGGGWNYSVSYSFGKTITDAEVPDSPVIFDALGNLYGCSEGGTYGYGTVFELTPGTAGGTWTESILYNFQGGTADGAGPDTLVFDSAGHLYGTTASGGGSAGYGTVFELTRSSSGAWTETLPLLFDGKNGEYPDAFVRAPRGEFFGLTSEGGKTNDGVVFEFRP